MNSYNIIKGFSISLKRISLILALLWTVFLSTSLFYNVYKVNQETFQIVNLQASISQEKDILFRNWVANYGGVYVPIDEKTQPNSNLAHIPERDITTPSGKLLTLVNPAYMTRLLYEFGLEKTELRRNLTSLRPIFSGNVPDPWEKKALKSFELGSLEISGIDTIDGEEYYRLMRPLLTEKECLKCHAQQGYKVGDIRGGITISVPMKPYRNLSTATISRFSFVHLIVWLIGLGGILIGYFSLNKSDRKRNKAEVELLQLNQGLENRVKERTIEVANALQLIESILESAGDGIYGLDLDGNATFVNQKAAGLLGYAKEELLGEVMHANHHHHKQDGSEYPREECPIYSAFKDGLTHTITNEVFWRKDGTPFYVEYTSTPIFEDGKSSGAVVVFQDITERKKAEDKIKKANRVYAVLSNVNQTIVRVKDKQTLFNEACKIAVDDGKFRMAWIGLVDEQTNKVKSVSSSGFEDDYLKTINLDLSVERYSKGPTGRAITTGVHCVANDIENDPEMIPWRENALRQGYKSSAAFPIKVFGKTTGAFMLYSDEQFFFDEAEVKLLDEMAMDISFAIEFLETEIKRKLSEEKLHDAIERFNRLVSSLNDVVWTASIDGSEIIDVNDTFENIYGISLDEFKANPKLWFEMVHPDDKHIAEVSGKELFEKGKAESEYRIIKPDGTVVWLLDRKSLIYDESGKLIQIGGIAKDITERKIAEEATISSEFRYRRLFESAKDGVLILDAETGNIVDVNPFMVEMLGYSRELFIEKTIWEIGFFKDIIMNQDKFLELQKNEYVRYEDLPLETADGRILDVEFISNVYLVNDKKVVQCNIRNITERKAADKLIITQRDLGTKINSITKLDELYTVSIDALQSVTGMECGGIYLFDKKKQCLDLVYSKGLSEKYLSVTSHYEAGSDNVQLVKTGKPVFAEFDEFPVTYNNIKHDEKLESVFVLPLVYKEGVIGSINLASQKKVMLSIYLQKGVEAIATLISNAYGRIQNEKEIRNMNVELEDKVEERTEQIAEINRNLYKEIEERKLTETQLILQSTALNAAANAIVITDSDGHIEWVNTAFKKLTGYTIEEVKGKNPNILKSGKHDDVFYKNLWHIILAGKVWHGEIINKRKDGNEYTEEMTITPLKDEKGEIVRFIAIKQDISRRKKIETGLEETRKELAVIKITADEVLTQRQ
jgi:PAS domain S-box-containing protein